MKIRTKLIPLSFAKPKMILAAPVRGDEGQILLTAETELSENSLASLRTRNISSISVREEDSRSEEELANERIKITEHIDALFHQDNASIPPSLESLRQMILEYRIEPHL